MGSYPCSPVFPQWAARVALGIDQILDDRQNSCATIYLLAKILLYTSDLSFCKFSPRHKCRQYGGCCVLEKLLMPECECDFGKQQTSTFNSGFGKQLMLLLSRVSLGPLHPFYYYYLAEEAGSRFLTKLLSLNEQRKSTGGC